MHKRGLCRRAVAICPSVCPSVTFLYSIETNKYIFRIFSPSGRHTILLCPYQTLWQYSDGDPQTGASNAGGVDKNRDSRRISGYRKDNRCSANNNCDGDRAVYRIDHHTLMILFITTSMYDHDEEKRTDLNCMRR